MRCQADEVGFEFSVSLGFDSHMGSIFEIEATVTQSAARTVADGVAGVFDRQLTNILDDRALLLEEHVTPRGG